MSKKRLFLGLLLALLPSTMEAVWQPPYLAPVLPPSKFKRGIVLLPQLEYYLGYNAIDSAGKGQSMENLVFGQVVKIKDVSMASRLAHEGDLMNGTATPVGGGTYLGALAETEVEFNFKQKMFRVAANGSMKFNKDLCGGVQWSLGFVVPFEYYEHYMHVELFNPLTGLVVGATNIDSFFADHNHDFREYWREDILKLKGLNDTVPARSIGIGTTRFDVTLSLDRDWGTSYFSALLGVPTGTAPDGNTVWPIERGTSRSWQLGFRGDWNFDLNDKWQMYVKADMMKSFAMGQKMRVPKLMDFAAGTTLLDAGITANSRFTGKGQPATATTDYKLRWTTSEFDSTVPYFSEKAIDVKRRLGLISTARAGFKYNASPFDLSFWYDFYYRRKDSVRASDTTPTGTFNYDTVTARTNQKRHTVGWMTEYGLNHGVKLGVGSTHVFKGKNTPKYHAAHVNFTSYF